MFSDRSFNFRSNAEKGRDVLEKFVDMALDQSFNPRGKVSGALAAFRVDVIDADERYDLYAELPGFTKEEITVSYDEDGCLTISAQSAVETEDDDVKYVCRERKHGKVEREFIVDDIAKDEVSVSFENGLLHIILPKVSADANKKIFDIN